MNGKYVLWEIWCLPATLRKSKELTNKNNKMKYMFQASCDFLVNSADHRALGVNT